MISNVQKVQVSDTTKVGKRSAACKQKPLMYLLFISFNALTY